MSFCLWPVDVEPTESLFNSFYFPKANIVAVDANKPEAEVWKAIQAALDGAGIKPLPK